MSKWIFGLFFLVNVIFFSLLHWGGALTTDTANPPLQVPLNADKIKLLDMSASATAAETPASSYSAASTVAPTAPPPTLAAIPPSEKPNCMEWGEFSATDLPRAEKALAPLKLGHKLKQHVIEYASGYWVYIAPLKTHAQVEKKIAQLKERGVADYFVIQEIGAWQNAISLGVFKTEEAAKKYLAQLRGKGVKSAALGERGSKLKYTVFTLNQLDSTASSQIAALHKDFPDSELKLVPCN